MVLICPGQRNSKRDVRLCILSAQILTTHLERHKLSTVSSVSRFGCVRVRCSVSVTFLLMLVSFAKKQLPQVSAANVPVVIVIAVVVEIVVAVIAVVVVAVEIVAVAVEIVVAVEIAVAPAVEIAEVVVVLDVAILSTPFLQGLAN